MHPGLIAWPQPSLNPPPNPLQRQITQPSPDKSFFQSTTKKKKLKKTSISLKRMIHTRITPGPHYSPRILHLTTQQKTLDTLPNHYFALLNSCKPNLVLHSGKYPPTYPQNLESTNPRPKTTTLSSTHQNPPKPHLDYWSTPSTQPAPHLEVAKVYLSKASNRHINGTAVYT